MQRLRVMLYTVREGSSNRIRFLPMPSLSQDDPRSTAPPILSDPEYPTDRAPEQGAGSAVERSGGWPGAAWRRSLTRESDRPGCRRLRRQGVAAGAGTDGEVLGVGEDQAPIVDTDRPPMRRRHSYPLPPDAVSAAKSSTTHR